MTTFNDQLRSFRLAKNLTQKAMASLLNITERQYQRYELGTSFPRFHDLILLADFFDVSLDELVGRKR